MRTQLDRSRAEIVARDVDIELLLEKLESWKAAKSPGRVSGQDVEYEPGARPATAMVAMCYKDYCPCDPPQDGMDSILCGQLEQGLHVDIQLIIGERRGREARRQMAEMG